MAPIRVEFAGRSYKSPLWIAAGTFGWGVEALDGGYFPSQGAGAYVSKGVSDDAMLGAPQPRVAEVGEGIGFLNAIGLQNPGVQTFSQKYLPRYFKQELGIPCWINVLGKSEASYAIVLERVIETLGTFSKESGVAGFEINVSCPNVDHGGAEFGSNSHVCESLVSRLVKISQGWPLMIKLSPAADQIQDVARACEASGATALSLCNTMPALLPQTLGRKGGGLSGPALRPLSLRAVELISRTVKLPVCGVGGISKAQHVHEYFSAGAKVVQIGTAHLANPWICDQIFAQF